MIEYTTKKVGERRKFREFIAKWGYFKFVIFWMRGRLKIETTFDNWDKNKRRKKMGKTLTITEVIIVIAVFSLLTAIVILGISRARQFANCVAGGNPEKWCQDNFKILEKGKEKQQLENEKTILSDFEKDIKEW